MSSTVTTKQLRGFGLIVGGVWALLGLWPVFFQATNPRLWALVLTALFVLPALAIPKILRPVYRVWMAVGQILGWINTRILLSLIFYGVFAPLGVLLRRKDLLRLRFEPETETYRIIHPVRPANHLKKQF